MNTDFSSTFTTEKLTKAINDLERCSRQLEPDFAKRSEETASFILQAENFIDWISKAPPFQSDSGRPADNHWTPPDSPLPLKKIFENLEEIQHSGLNIGSPFYMAFLPGGGIYHGALGDYLAAICNRHTGTAFGAPAARKMEWMLLDWLRRMCGFPQSFCGDLTSGGSTATLTALLTARDDRLTNPKLIDQAVIYHTDQAHHCIEKALKIIGLGRARRRIIDTDEKLRMRPCALKFSIEKDLGKGFMPWLVVATAGTTNTGTIDPIAAIADIAQENGLWFHIDGAYGAAFQLCPQGPERLNGLDRADSLVIDPHKGFFLPLGSGVVLVREGHTLKRTTAYQADYIEESSDIIQEVTSIELSRPFRGLRLWLPLVTLGLAPFQAALEEKLLLAELLYLQLSSNTQLEMGPPPDLSIVTLRVRTFDAYDDEPTQILLKQVRKDGRIFLSSTRIKGRLFVRVAILGFRVHIEEVNLVRDIINEFTTIRLTSTEPHVE